jgi:hypothetical protein
LQLSIEEIVSSAAFRALQFLVVNAMSEMMRLGHRGLVFDTPAANTH